MPKAPKIKPADPAAKTPDPAIIRNPYLDDVNSFAQSRKGRSQLRIDPILPRIPLPASAGPVGATYGIPR